MPALRLKDRKRNQQRSGKLSQDPYPTKYNSKKGKKRNIFAPKKRLKVPYSNSSKPRKKYRYAFHKGRINWYLLYSSSFSKA